MEGDVMFPDASGRSKIVPQHPTAEKAPVKNNTILPAFTFRLNLFHQFLINNLINDIPDDNDLQRGRVGQDDDGEPCIRMSNRRSCKAPRWPAAMTKSIRDALQKCLETSLSVVVF